MSREMDKEKLAELWVEGIAPALQTDYHRGKHKKSFLAGFETALEEAAKVARSIPDTERAKAATSNNSYIVQGQIQCAQLAEEAIRALNDEEREE